LGCKGKTILGRGLPVKRSVMLDSRP